jgi:hypothetical protein
METLIIPDYDPINPENYPGNIKPGDYSGAEVKALIKRHKGNPAALQFISDMQEE